MRALRAVAVFYALVTAGAFAGTLVAEASDGQRCRALRDCPARQLCIADDDYATIGKCHHVRLLP